MVRKVPNGAFPCSPLKSFKCPLCKQRFRTVKGVVQHGYLCWPVYRRSELIMRCRMEYGGRLSA
jgi:hypothetical protein